MPGNTQRRSFFVVMLDRDYTNTCELGLGEKIFDQLAIVFFFNTREEPRAEFSDCGWLVERQTVVHLSTAEVTRHALRLEDWFELSIKIDVRLRCVRNRSGCGVRASYRPEDAAGFDEQQRHRHQTKHHPHVAIIRLRNLLRNGRCVQLRIPRREPDVLRAETISGFFSSLI